jgi:hypothetical protein
LIGSSGTLTIACSARRAKDRSPWRSHGERRKERPAPERGVRVAFDLPPLPGLGALGTRTTRLAPWATLLRPAGRRDFSSVRATLRFHSLAEESAMPSLLCRAPWKDRSMASGRRRRRSLRSGRLSQTAINILQYAIIVKTGIWRVLMGMGLCRGAFRGEAVAQRSNRQVHAARPRGAAMQR